jgi:hypothetical protein
MGYEQCLYISHKNREVILESKEVHIRLQRGKTVFGIKNKNKRWYSEIRTVFVIKQRNNEIHEIFSFMISPIS